MDAKDGLTPREVRELELELHLEAARAQQGFVNQILAIRHPEQKHIVEWRHAVQQTQELVDQRVVHESGALVGVTARTADGVELIKDDDVQVGGGPLALLL